MDLKLAGKRALVTGASSGIGIEVAKLFAAEGVVVVANGRDRTRTENTVREIERAGGQAIAAIGELTSDEGADAVAEVANKALGGIDILINNAGGGSGTTPRPWHEVTMDNYIDVYNLNVLATLRLIHRFAPGMSERGWGRIINVSTAIARQAIPMLPDYVAAKIAIERLSLELSLSLAPTGVTVNTVVPGTILSPTSAEFVDKMRDQYGWPEEEKEKLYCQEFAQQSVPRLGRPEDIANAMLFLCSPLSGYTTAAILRIDGGMAQGFF